MGVTGKMVGQLKRDGVIELESGRVIRLDDVTVPVAPPKTVIVLGDTSDPSRMRDVCNTCDVMVHESTFKQGCEDMAVARGHSTSTMAAAFARSLSCKTLLLTHFSARYKLSECADLVAQAQKVCMCVCVLFSILILFHG